MYNMQRELNRRLDVLLEALSQEQSDKIDELITDLEELQATQMDFSSMPGGVNPVDFYLDRASASVASISNYRREPRLDPEVERQRMIDQDAAYKAGAEKLVPLLPKKIVASVAKDGIVIVRPDGTGDYLSAYTVLREPKTAKKMVDDYLEKVKAGEYAALVDEVNWLKAVGFMPVKSNELARWRFKFPSVNAELFGKQLLEDGTANYDIIFKGNITQAVDRTRVPLDGWTHDQIEELVDTLATVTSPMERMMGAIHSQSQASLGDKRFVKMQLQIDNIGDHYILYRIELELRMRGDSAHNPETVVEIPSNTIKSSRQVIDKLLEGLRHITPRKGMRPVAGEAQ